MLKVAQYAAQLEDYEKAIQIYEQVASSCLESSLLKYSAKEYFFRASLCHLSIDLLNATHALEKYAQQYPAFQDSREYKLVMVNCDFYLFFFGIFFLFFFLCFLCRLFVNILKNQILMDLPMLLKNTIVFHDWINGTQLFC